MEHIANRTDESLQQAVEAALITAIGTQTPRVGVAADHGEVTLTGRLANETDRAAAHAATVSVWGVHAVADDIVVRDARTPGTTDTGIAIAAQKALQHAEGVPLDSVLVEVRKGAVTLTGTVASASERLAAERVVTYVPGITEIDNRVTLEGHA